MNGRRIILLTSRRIGLGRRKNRRRMNIGRRRKTGRNLPPNPTLLNPPTWRLKLTARAENCVLLPNPLLATLQV